MVESLKLAIRSCPTITATTTVDGVEPPRSPTVVVAVIVHRIE